eukprot:16447807-Heterocapsa_arctica.AAC.1
MRHSEIDRFARTPTAARLANYRLAAGAAATEYFEEFHGPDVLPTLPDGLVPLGHPGRWSLGQLKGRAQLPIRLEE